jgi:hypothetical protein
MTILDDRERGEEARFRHDQDLAFRVRDRRDRLFGPWVARDLLDLGEEAAAAYAGDVVLADFEAPGDSDVIAKVRVGLVAAGREIAEHVPQERLTGSHTGARRRVAAE